MKQLAEFETISKANLVASPCLHVDETGININGCSAFLCGSLPPTWLTASFIFSSSRFILCAHFCLSCSQARQAYEQLAEFETISKANLVASPYLHVDETGININGKRHWLHGTSNDKWTHFFPHAKRGTEACGSLPPTWLTASFIFSSSRFILCAHFCLSCSQARVNSRIWCALQSEWVQSYL
jgi:hypothetical protein